MGYAGGEIWAIDPATRTGFATGVPGATPKLSVYNFGEDKDGHTALFGRATFFLAERLSISKPALIVIEAPVPPSQKPGATHYNASEIALGLNGIFHGIAHCKRIPVMTAHIGSWRKFFLGNGRLKGAEAKRECLKLCEQMRWDANGDHNAAEAAGIWCWAVSQVDPMLARRTEPLFARVPT